MPVNHLSEVDRVERQLEAALAARPRDNATYLAGLEEAIALSRTDPDAAEVFHLPELLDELAEAYGEAGRFDDALHTMRQAIDACLSGARNEPCWCGSTRKYKTCCGAPRTGEHG